MDSDVKIRVVFLLIGVLMLNHNLLWCKFGQRFRECHSQKTIFQGRLDLIILVQQISQYLFKNNLKSTTYLYTLRELKCAQQSSMHAFA